MVCELVQGKRFTDGINIVPFGKHHVSLYYLFLTHFSLSGAFVICWTPGLVILLLDGINCQKCHVLKFKTWFLLLATLNSVMNPIIYSYKDKDMWRTIKNIICSLACLRHRGRPRNSQRGLKPHSDTLPIQEMGIESQCSVEEKLQD